MEWLTILGNLAMIYLGIVLIIVAVVASIADIATPFMELTMAGLGLVWLAYENLS